MKSIYLIQSKKLSDPKKIVVVSDDILSDNKFSSDRNVTFEFWNKYNIFFDETTYILRCNKKLKPKAALFDLKEIKFDCVGSNSNPILKLLMVIKFFLKGINEGKESIVLIRFPSLYGLAFILGRMLFRQNYYLEVIADAQFSYTNYPIIQKLLFKIQRKIIYNAASVSYVTESYFQKKYPHPDIKNFFYSSIILDDNFFYKRPPIKLDGIKNDEFRILNVTGHINNDLKGHNLLIDIAEELLFSKIKFKMIIVGDGKYLKKIKAQTKSKQLTNVIEFRGYLNPEKLSETYISSDCFLYTSKTEGIPRVIIEAMANSLPIISSNVGGIKEILDPYFTLDLQDLKSFVKRLIIINKNGVIYNNQSNKNFLRAMGFRNEMQSKKRAVFFEHIHDMHENSRRKNFSL